MAVTAHFADAIPNQHQDRTQQVRMLCRLNAIACLLHLGLALSAVVSTIDKGPVNVPTFWESSQWNLTACMRQGYGESTTVCPSGEIPDESGMVNFSAVLICSQLITCAFHGWLYMQTLSAHDNRSAYTLWSLDAGIKVFHWLEYTVTASLISHVVLYFSGVISIRSQMLGYASQSSLMLIGLLQDILRHCGIVGVLPVRQIGVLLVFTFIVGFYNVMAVWFPSLYVLFGDNDGADPPAFVKWVVLAEATLYTSFGIAQLAFFVPFLYNGATYRTRFYLEEVVFSVLSFAAKATLASAFSACLVYRSCGDS